MDELSQDLEKIGTELYKAKQEEEAKKAPETGNQETPKATEAEYKEVKGVGYGQRLLRSIGTFQKCQ